jgi:alpha-amylase
MCRIYVDAVINHMAGHGSGTGLGSAGSWYDSHRMDFPGVPYGPSDFNCCQCDGRCTTASCDIENYGDSNQVRDDSVAFCGDFS